MLTIYRSIINLIYPFIIVLIRLRVIFKKEDTKRYKEKLFVSSFNVINELSRKLIWVHVASIGEYKSVLPIINSYDFKKFKFLITSVTLSSANIIKEDFPDEKNVIHRFFPVDKLKIVEKFLDAWKPNLTIFVDSEIWPNFLFELKKRKIPLIILNGRITKKTFTRWMIVPSFAKKIFNTFDLCLASSNESKKFLEKLNARNIKYIGNIKLAATLNFKNNNNINKELFLSKKIWCAVSTHKGEEIFCLKVHKILKEKFNNIITIIIPRHINRSNEINILCKKNNLRSQIVSGKQVIEDHNEIVIVNEFNVLSKYLKYAKSVFVGKSIIENLKKVGGQNPIEAAQLGCRVYHGPYVYNFEEIYNFLNEHGISEKISNENQLAKKLSNDFDHTNEIKVQNNNKIFEVGNRILKESIEQINKLEYDKNY